jgi:hypothetical protein
MPLHRYYIVYIALASRVAQNSVWLRAGREGNRGSIPGRGERIFPVACVQTGSGAHPASCPMGPFPVLKRGRGVTLATPI